MIGPGGQLANNGVHRRGHLILRCRLLGLYNDKVPDLGAINYQLFLSWVV